MRLLSKRFHWKSQNAKNLSSSIIYMKCLKSDLKMGVLSAVIIITKGFQKCYYGD